MKKIILSLSCSLLFGNDITGTYIVTTIVENGKTQHPNTEVSFKKDGKYYMMGVPFGQWKSGGKDVVYVNTAFKPKFEKFRVSDSADGMILQNSSGKMVYKKINKQKMIAQNSNSFLLGSWVYKTKNYSEKIIFGKPDTFKCIEQDDDEGSTTKGNGKWIYDNGSLTITAFGCKLSGKYRVKKEGDAIFIDGKKYVGD